MSRAKTKLFRVLIEDTTFYHAYITAKTEAEAMEIADGKFCDNGVEGFTAEERCDIAHFSGGRVPVPAAVVAGDVGRALPVRAIWPGGMFAPQFRALSARLAIVRGRQSRLRRYRRLGSIGVSRCMAC